MRRYVILAAAVIMQLCLGATYSWSIYVQPLKAMTGLLQGPVQLPFTVFYFIFPATMVVAGNLLPRIGPRRCAMVGGLLFGSGWLLAGWGVHHFGFTVLGIGVLAGMGVGFAYIVPIATCIRWFPRHKGLVTGIAVAGFGGGAALVSQAGALLMGAYGATPFETFTRLGFFFLVLVLLTGYCMQNPPGTSLQARDRKLWRQILRHPGFQVLYIAMLCGLAAGFAVNANLKELFQGGSLKAGITAVAVFALANAVGRVTWGWLFDRFAALTMVIFNLMLQAGILFLSPWILHSDAGLMLFAAVTGLNYGGVLVLYASSVARIWGSASVGQVYGLLFSANIPAALAPLLAGMLFDSLGSFTPALWGIALLITAAAVLLMLTRHKTQLTN